MKEGTLKKHCTKARRKTIRESMKFWVKTLLRSWSPFRFVGCNILLSLVLVPHLVYSLGSQDSGIYNISRTPAQFRLASLSKLHETVFLGLHADIPLTHVWHQWLSLAVEEDSITTFLYSCLQSQNHMTEVAKLCCLMGLELIPRFKYILYQLSVVGYLHSLSFSPDFLQVDNLGGSYLSKNSLLSLLNLASNRFLL